jgi:ATP-binding cassette subfamily B protein
MLFGKHFRKYYIKYALFFLTGVFVLIAVDWYQLEIPKIIGSIIDNLYEVNIDEQMILDGIKRIALLAGIIAIGRFLWRYTIFGASRRIEYQLQNVMFRHATKLSPSYSYGVWTRIIDVS